MNMKLFIFIFLSGFAVSMQATPQYLSMDTSGNGPDSNAHISLVKDIGSFFAVNFAGVGNPSYIYIHAPVDTAAGNHIGTLSVGDKLNLYLACEDEDIVSDFYLAHDRESISLQFVKADVNDKSEQYIFARLNAIESSSDSSMQLIPAALAAMAALGILYLSCRRHVRTTS